MVYDRGFSTYYIAMSSEIFSGLGEFFSECDGAPIPEQVVSYIRAYFRFQFGYGEVCSGWRYTIRFDWGEGCCQLLDCRKTKPTDIPTKSGAYVCYSLWGNPL